ncbi:MAG: hypothetical protein ACOY44_03345 [Pseudomonadota bacterium]
MSISELRTVNIPATQQAPGSGASSTRRVAVLGAGDVGAAVAHALHRAGCRVLLVEGAAPTSPRRGMCFVDAVFDGACVVDGVTALRVDWPDAVETAWALNRWLPLAVVPDLPRWLDRLGIDFLVDARMRKHGGVHPDLRPFAHHTLGLGPGYIAGHNATIAIETAWGDHLGQVIDTGPTRRQAGDPRPILGASRERLVFSPIDGVFQSDLHIGEAVMRRQPVGWIEGRDGRTELVSPLTGSLRGLTRPGLRVASATRVVEVDPRGDPALCFGLAERPRRIAQGVLQALDRLSPPTALQRPPGNGAVQACLLRGSAL